MGRSRTAVKRTLLVNQLCSLAAAPHGHLPSCSPVTVEDRRNGGPPPLARVRSGQGSGWAGGITWGGFGGGLGRSARACPERSPSPGPPPSASRRPAGLPDRPRPSDRHPRATPAQHVGEHRPVDAQPPHLLQQPLRPSPL